MANPKTRVREMSPYSMSRIRWKCWKCYLIWGSKKYGSWWFSKNKKKPYSGNFVPTFLNVNRVLLFVQDRHNPWLEAAESPPVLLWSAPKCFFLQDILTQRNFSPNLKQMEVTRTLDFAAICKFEFWRKAITLGDTEYVSETILKVLCQKF